MSEAFKDPRWNRYDEKRKYRRLIAWTEDNAQHLPPDYIPSLLAKYGKNLNMVKAHLYGEFCPLYEGNAYPTYLSKHDIQDLSPDPYIEIDLTMDFNANPVAWVAVQKRRIITPYALPTFPWVIVHEAAEDNSQLDDAVIEFMAKFPVMDFADTPINVFGDRSGHAASHKVRGSDYDAVRNLLVWAGYKNVTIRAAKEVALETASVDALCMLFLRDLLFLCSRCKLTKRSLMATTWTQGARKLHKPAGETWTHHADAAKYWAWQKVKYGEISFERGKKVLGKNW